jgi:hypothetical protein
MKNYLLVLILTLSITAAFAQSGKKPLGDVGKLCMHESIVSNFNFDYTQTQRTFSQ